MLSQKYRNRYDGSGIWSEYVPISVLVFGESSDSDTFITDSPYSDKQVYEPLVERFLPLPQGEENSDLLLRRRPYIKAGVSGGVSYRSVFLFSPRSAILRETGDRIYNVERVSLKLKAIGDTRLNGLQAVLLSSSTVDETVSWTKPTELQSATWVTTGGDSDTPLSGEVTRGSWSEDGTITFDISEMYTQWAASGRSVFAVARQSDVTESGVQNFHSWDSNEGYLGDAVLTNCRFLAQGDANSTRTEGVRAVLSDSSGNVLITQAETNANRLAQFYSFQFSAPLGATFTLLDPDINNSATVGTKICTVVDKPSADSLLVSGFTLPNGLSEHQTTVEFAAETTIPYGSHILELQTPSTETVNETLALYTDQKLKVRYYNPPANNNSRNFTVAFVSDERRYKDRIRVFLNEQTVSENRNGLGTEILLSETKPVLMIDLLLV